MPKKTKQKINKQLLVHSRPQRNMKMKKVFDPSDTHIPKKRKTFGSKVPESDSNPPRSVSPQEIILMGNCFVCTRSSLLRKLRGCPVCEIKVHKRCLLRYEPIWRAKLNSTCSWFCKSCRVNNCNICSGPKSNLDFRRCKSCKVGIHSKCIIPNDPNALSLTGVSGMFLCNPCKISLSQNNIQEEQEKEEKSFLKSEENNHLLNVLTKVPDFEQKWEVPDITGWDKFQVYQYLKDHNLPVEITDIIIKNDLDGEAVYALSRPDIILNMGLKLGPALKLYKEIRILQCRNTSFKVYWGNDIPELV